MFGIRFRRTVRRIEDKMDAKSLLSESFYIRCADPPSRKKVPQTFPAWVILESASFDTNVFATSHLLQSRTAVSFAS